MISIFVTFFANFVYFAHELGLQLVAKNSRAVFISVIHRNKTTCNEEKPKQNKNISGGFSF
jgi:hypothetical protein